MLTITERLRKLGVVGKFVEFFGPGLEFLTIADRATLGNSRPSPAPPSRSAPIDEMTLDYLRLTGARAGAREARGGVREGAGAVPDPGAPTPFTPRPVELDLSTVEPSLAGPKRPQDRVSLRQCQAPLRGSARDDAGRAQAQGGGGHAKADGGGAAGRGCARVGGSGHTMPAGSKGSNHGAVVVAAITSCTNTSNPSVMIAAGLLARERRARAG